MSVTHLNSFYNTGKESGLNIHSNILNLLFVRVFRIRSKIIWFRDRQYSHYSASSPSHGASSSDTAGLSALTSHFRRILNYN